MRAVTISVPCWGCLKTEQVSLPFDLLFGECQLPMVNRDDRGRREGRTVKRMESKRHVSDQDSILSPRALPTLSSGLSALYLLPHIRLLSPVTSVQQGTTEMHEHPAHPWPLPKLISVQRRFSCLQWPGPCSRSGPFRPAATSGS